MRVLIIYRRLRIIERVSTKDHLYSFKRYAKGCKFFYLDLCSPGSLTKSLLSCKFDVVIFHPTFLQYRSNGAYHAFYKKIRNQLKSISGTKVLMPFDDYIDTSTLWEICKDNDVSWIFTPCHSEDFDLLYPRTKIGSNCRIDTVLTGYVDNRYIKKFHSHYNHTRSIDIGYRATETNFICGKHGELKRILADEFIAALENHTDIAADIGTSRNKQVFYGKKWFDFLFSCRTMLGCLGGSSLMDKDGSIRRNIVSYLKANIAADYSDVEKECFPGQDGMIKGYSMGPKIFEYAIAKTCPVLVEGSYCGLVEPGIHYIEVKKDFSNINDVIDKVRDHEYCKKLAENLYEDLVLSGKYSYEEHVNSIIRKVAGLLSNTKLSLYDHISWFLMKINPYYKMLSLYTVVRSESPVNNIKLLIRHVSPKLYELLKNLKNPGFRQKEY